MLDHPPWLDDDRAGILEVWSPRPVCICIWDRDAPQRIDGQTHWPLKQRNRKCKLHGEHGDR